MKKYIFLTILSLLIIRVNNRRQFQIGNTEYSLRITNLTDCDKFAENPQLRNIKFSRNGYTQLINGQFAIENDFCIKLISINLYRCLNNNYACEYFQHWNISDACIFTKMPNAIWRPFFDSMTPSDWLKHCPCFKKSIITLNNASISVNEIMKFYSEASNYHWQIRARTYDKHSVQQNCLYLTFYITSYNSKIPLPSEISST